MTGPTKLDVPRPGFLFDAILTLEELEDDLQDIIIGIRDRINDVERTAGGSELGKLWNAQVFAETAARRNHAALIYLKEVASALPSLRSQLVEVGLSS